MLILAFGFLAVCAALEVRSRSEPLLRPDPHSDRSWLYIGTASGVIAVFGPLVVMARIGLAEGAAASLLGAVFAGFAPARWWPVVSPMAGVFGFGLLSGALLR